MPHFSVLSLAGLPLWTLECLVHGRGILHSMASDQGNHFTAKEVR